MDKSFSLFLGNLDIHFYDDTDDEDFEDVQPDQNEAEIEFMDSNLITKAPTNKNQQHKNEKQVLPNKKKTCGHYSTSNLNDIEADTPLFGQHCGGIVVPDGVFAVADEAKELPEESVKQMSARYYALEDFEAVTQSVNMECKHKMPDGSLCKRRDRVKCPFHGKIIPRDEYGSPLDKNLSPSKKLSTPCSKVDKRKISKTKTTTSKQRLAQKLKLKKL